MTKKETVTIALPKIEDCEISWEFVPEDQPFEGEFENEAIEQEVREQLDQGDLAAWFMATLTVSFHGLEGLAHIGCCSYSSFDEFKKCDYAGDMKDQALEQIHKALKKMAIA